MHRELGAAYRASSFVGTYGEWLRMLGYGPGRPRGGGGKRKSGGSAG